MDSAGGQEKMVAALANALSEKGYEIYLLILTKEYPVFYPLHNNIKTLFFKADFGINKKESYLQRKLDFFNDIQGFNKIVREIAPQLIISTAYPITVAIAVAGLFNKIKTINWEHNSYVNEKSFFWSRFSKFAYRKMDRIVTLNTDEEGFYKKYNKATVVIPNFIEPSDQVSSLEQNTLLTIARIEEGKGIKVLLKTAYMVLNQHQNWKWIFIADGDINDVFPEDKEALLLPENFIHIKETKEIVDAYKEASIYVMTSSVESFGMVLIEAMNFGVPPIAIDCETGPRHIIENNVNGLLVEKKNPFLLANAISMLIHDKSKRKEMGLNAKYSVKKFYKYDVVQLWENLINTLN